MRKRRFFGAGHWDEPLKWNRAAEKEGIRRRVFCGSMCDVMEESNAGCGAHFEGKQFIHEQTVSSCRLNLLDIIERTPWLDWLMLTKRPQNFRRFLPKAWLESPRPNVWGMTTVRKSAGVSMASGRTA